MPGSPRLRRQFKKEATVLSDHEPGGLHPPTKYGLSASAAMSHQERRHLLPAMPEEDTEVPRTWQDYMPKGHAFTFPVVTLHLILGAPFTFSRVLLRALNKGR